MQEEELGHWRQHGPFDTEKKKRKVESPLTHPDLSEAALTQFELQLQRLPGNLPRILGQALSLRLDRGTHRRQPVAQSVGVLCRCGKKTKAKKQESETLHHTQQALHKHTHTHTVSHTCDTLNQREVGSHSFTHGFIPFEEDAFKCSCGDCDKI